MHSFTDMIQPMTNWLYAHPHWALLITFIISFTESLAIIGSIIPGSVTMTAIGMLAGSGIMRVDLTFLAAILGAIAGDTGSYTIGFIFSHRLTHAWPFSRYPTWLEYGKAYFERYGAISVLIGRFVGPIRSIIPVIAGMMQMNRFYFIFANIISAIGWSILYVLPGVLIGLAGTELSTEGATRLFVSILIVLIVMWAAGLGIKWLFINTNQFLHVKLHAIWMHLKSHSLFPRFLKNLAPPHEVNHYPTAGLTLLLMFSVILFVLMMVLIYHDNTAYLINHPTYLFLQSLRTQSFDVFFVVFNLMIGAIPLLTLYFSFIIYTIYYRQWRTLRYWLSLGLISSLIFCVGIHQPSIKSLASTHLAIATSLFGFFSCYLSRQYQTHTLLSVRILLCITLFLAGIGALYLGDNVLINVMAAYFIGTTIALMHWVFYRRIEQSDRQSQHFICIISLVVALASGVSCLIYFNKEAQAHSRQPPVYVIAETIWWNQKHPLLPLYTTNRIGKTIGLLNVQYAGSITKLSQTLEMKGWKMESISFFHALLLRASGTNLTEELPLMAHLYLNRKPALIMTYDPGNQQELLVLRLWQSNYHLSQKQESIWIGNLAPRVQQKPGKTQSYQGIAIQSYLLQSLPKFKYKQIWLPKRYLKPLPNPESSLILIIKQPRIESRQRS